MTDSLTADAAIAVLQEKATPEKRAGYERAFPAARRGEDQFIGVRMGEVFALAKTLTGMPLPEIERLLESPIHEARVCAVSIMDFEARAKKTPPERRRELFELYLRRHDRIDSWDLVDRSAIYVVGSYLADKPRDVLYDLARSERMPERRTAIVTTIYFSMKLRQPDDTFAIAELLVDDPEDLIHKAVGWAVRVAGGDGLRRFLDAHAATMPRVMLRAAIEKLPYEERQDYLGKRTKNSRIT